jgi:D-glycero-D-manno-heptose 1,7-bisphosphate phosphatase
LKRAVFLDRDGVLNEAILRNGRPFPPMSPDELTIIQGAATELGRLKEAGFMLLVVTNQPDVARGSQRREAVEALNDKIAAALPVDEFFVCWHDDSDDCDCRKPKPGLLLAAAAKHGIDLQRSFLIGDRWRDIDAGALAGCRTALIDYKYHERQPENDPDFRGPSISDAVGWILSVCGRD